MAVDKKLIKAYDMVFNDLESNQLGWKKRKLKIALAILGHRQWELENVWSDNPTVEVNTISNEEAK
jgi:hypothetical protein